MCAKLPCAPNSISSMVAIMQNTQEKADLQKMKVNDTKIGKARVNGNKLYIGGHRPSSLGCRSIVVVG